MPACKAWQNIVDFMDKNEKYSAEMIHEGGDGKSWNILVLCSLWEYKFCTNSPEAEHKF